MFKNALKAATALAILSGCYFGYVRAFELVVRQFEVKRLDNSMTFAARSSKSHKEAKDLARLAFGPDHWTVTDALPFAYYNSQRGFWMYWREYEEIKEENGVRYDGKRVRMRPFAMIGRSGKSIFRLTGEEAILDLNQPIAITSKTSEAIKVEHAVIERNVWIHDDRGTPGVIPDDMNMGPFTYLEFDEASHLITTRSHFFMEDPDQKTEGDGLKVRLRSPDPALAGSSSSSSSSGFAGAEYAILERNPRVTMRDAGNSGVVPGGTKAPAAGKAGAGKAKASEGPTPLFIRADGEMRLDFPPDALPVPVGPPSPPRPTLVRFERNVVAVHGQLDKQPNQLDCDVLRLTLIPAEPAPPPPKAKDGEKRKTEPAKAADTAGQVAVAAPAAAADDDDDFYGGWEDEAPSKGGLFGNLTLQKAHATGHAVWLQLREQAAKVLCVEMIHERSLPYRPDSTFFRGEKTRPVVLEKIDYEPEEESESGGGDDGSTPEKPRKVQSFTQVLTMSAKLFDHGHGQELMDVRAFGPGRLETRPDISQPVERIAVWQDELTIVNMVGPDGTTLQQKRVTLTGNRPFFVDLPKKTSLDAAQEIRVFLKPKAQPPAPAAATASAPATSSTTPTTVAQSGSPTALGGSLQIERLLAYRDVHFKAPSRYMEARSWLDAPFIEVEPSPPPAPAPAAEGAPEAGPPAPAENPPPAENKAEGPKKPEATPEPAEPTMTAVADRIWAKVAIPKGQSLDPAKDRKRSKAAAAEPEKEGEAEVREAWLRGNVAVHQDKPPDPEKKDQPKPKGDDVNGEAVYLDNNKGKGKAIAIVYHRDPTDGRPLPGPIRWAKVATDDMLIYGETLWMDQEQDKVWALGPGTLSQWAERSMMTDKAEEPAKAPEQPADGPPDAAKAAPKPATPPKPKTRAGMPVGEKDLLTITWTEQMQFSGRDKDPSGHPAARADFFGTVDANMTDARLHCVQKMIVFTDREVPLGTLGAATGRPGQGAADGRDEPEIPDGDENADRDGPAKSRVNIALIYCYGKPTAISRKWDPDVPVVLERQLIDAWDYKKPTGQERLDYNRRTGEFFVPGPGTVYLYNREEDNSQNAGAPAAGGAAASRGTTPTTARARPVARKDRPMILMQVKFRDGMKGRVGAGQANDNRQARSSHFFGNIEFLRSQVAHDGVVLNPDKRLSPDGFFLTSQMLRIIQEPPPPGSPEKTPSRTYAKAWDHVHVNRGEAFAIESDVSTFDSRHDALWAYGENGAGSASPSRAGPASRRRRATPRPSTTTSRRTAGARSTAPTSSAWISAPACGRRRCRSPTRPHRRRRSPRCRSRS